MGTRGYLVMKSGNVARAIFVCNDARDIGDRLRAMSDDDIEQLWKGIGRIVGNNKFSSHDLELMTDRTRSTFCCTTHVSAIYSSADIKNNTKRGFTGRDMLDNPSSGHEASCFQFPLDEIPAMEGDINIRMFKAAQAHNMSWCCDFAVMWVFDMDNNFIFHYGDTYASYEYPKSDAESKADLWHIHDNFRVMGQIRKPHPRSRQYVRTWKFAKGSDKVIYKGDLGERTARMILSGWSKEKLAEAGITVDM